MKCLVALPINCSHVLLLKIAAHHVGFDVWVCTLALAIVETGEESCRLESYAPRLDFIEQNVREI